MRLLRSLCFFALACALPLAGQNFTTQQIGSTNYLIPNLQLRFNASQFNPPMIFDLGCGATTTNILQAIGTTTANTVTLNIACPGQATTYKITDPGGANGTFMFLEASQTQSGNPIFSGTPNFSGAPTFSRTTNQFTVGAASHLDTVNFTAPAGATQTLIIPDSGNASDTFALLGLAQTFSAAQSFTGGVTLATTGLTLGMATNQFPRIGGLSHNDSVTFSSPTASTQAITFPDSGVSAVVIPYSVFTTCGSSAACSPTTVSSTVKIATGNCALSSASPSTCSVSGISPAFTSSTSYNCTATPEGTTAAVAAGGIAVNKTSGSAFTLTGPNTVTTVVDWTCIGT